MQLRVTVGRQLLQHCSVSAASPVVDNAFVQLGACMAETTVLARQGPAWAIVAELGTDFGVRRGPGKAP